MLRCLAELGVLRERVQRYEEEREEEREKAGGEEKRAKREAYLSLSNMTMPVEEKTQMIIELKAKVRRRRRRREAGGERRDESRRARGETTDGRSLRSTGRRSGGA